MKNEQSIEELLKFRTDALIEQQVESIDSLFRVTFLEDRPWMPSCTIMEELGITFCGCGRNNIGNFVILSTHKQESL